MAFNFKTLLILLFFISCQKVGIDVNKWGFAERPLKSKLGIGGSIPLDKKESPKETSLYSQFQAIIDNQCMSCHGVNGTGASFAHLNSQDAWANSNFISLDRDLEKSSIYNRLTGVNLGQAVENMPMGSSLTLADRNIIKDFIQSLEVVNIGSWEIKRSINRVIAGEEFEFTKEYQGFLSPKIKFEIFNLSDTNSLTIEDIEITGASQIKLIGNHSFDIPASSSKELLFELESSSVGNFNNNVKVITNNPEQKDLSFKLSGEIINSESCGEHKSKSLLEASTNEYFKFALRDLLEVEIQDIESHLPENLTTPVRGNLKIGRVDTEWFLTYQLMLEKTLDVMLSIQSHNGFSKVGSVLNCSLDFTISSNRQCFENFIQPLAKRALGKGYAGFANKIQLMLDTGINFSLDGDVIAKEILMAVLMDPHFTVYFEPATSELSQLDLVKKIYKVLWRSVPTLASINLAENGQFKANIHSQLDGILNHSNFKNRGFKTFVEYYLNKTFYHAQVSKHNILTQNQENSLWQSFSQSLIYIFEQNLPLASLLTLDKIFVNSDMASLNQNLYSTSQQLELVDTNEYKGLAMHPAFLAMTASAYQPTQEPLAPRRGLLYNQLFYCEKFSSTQPTVPHEDPAPGLSFREYFEQRTSSASCITCHDTLNPLGFAFHDRDFFGNIRTQDTVGKVIQTQGEIDGQKFLNVNDLSNLISQQSRLSHCFANHMFNFVQTSIQPESSQCYVKKSIIPNHNLTIKQIIKDIILHPDFPRRQL